jgi:modification methylase
MKQGVEPLAEAPLKESLNKVIEGDVLEVLRALPDESIDLGITSPPYNKKRKGGGWLVPSVKYNGYSDDLPEAEYQRWQIEVLNQLFRVTKEGGSFFYNHKVRYQDGKTIHPLSWLLNTQWTLWQEIIWDRGIAGNIRGWRFWQVEERIYWLVKGKPKELAPKHAKLTSIWRIPPETRHRDHPAVFPLELPARIIYSVLEDKPGIVIDPFCGTGTTLVAAKLLGKDYIGIEIDPYYVMYARKRLEVAESELPKINQELSLHFVRETFRERKARGMWKHKTKKQTSERDLLGSSASLKKGEEDDP